MVYDYEKTHARIIESATWHFMESGFSSASIRQICKDAGVTNGAFYAHFESKDDLFGKLVGPALRGLRELYASESSNYIEINSLEDVQKSLDLTFSTDEAIIHYIYEHADAFRLLARASAGTSFENLSNRIAEAEKQSMIAFFELCKPFVNNPDNMSDNLAEQVGSLIVSTIFGCLLADASEEETVREVQLASEFCVAGLRQIWGI